jgi:hypothetical protein
MHPLHDALLIMELGFGIPHFSHQGGEINFRSDQHSLHKPDPSNRGALQDIQDAGNIISIILDSNFMLY